ncbi:hypothetical protein Baya_2415 [Bagarius yarrelli]|uniref:Uncharacterized protein n=1 Tax=Bagarius yarrelli TaxID=175774 RepID=A0A556TNW0_BAGYA|nr:hypothetical protein Baya_2415 [Bagarius yarrelli]
MQQRAAEWRFKVRCAIMTCWCAVRIRAHARGGLSDEDNRKPLSLLSVVCSDMLERGLTQFQQPEEEEEEEEKSEHVAKK